MLLSLLIGEEVAGRARLEIPAQSQIDGLGNDQVKRPVTVKPGNR
jgi:hypothetical protein